MPFTCEACHSPLRAEDVRLDLSVARCHSCHAVYGLSGRKAQGLAAAQPPRPPDRPVAPLPSRFKLEEDGPVTRISWRWISLHFFLLALFCAGWDGFLIFWYAHVHLVEETQRTQHLLGPVFHVGFGVCLTYSTLAGLLNRTRVEVCQSHLTIRHGPIPWVGNRKVPVSQIKQFYGLESRGREGTGYSLHVVDREGRSMKLLSGLKEMDQVLYLEQALERRLGIEDMPVDGEVAQRRGTA